MAEAKSPKGGRRPGAGVPGGRSSHGGGRKVNRGRTSPPTPPVAAPEIEVAERPIGRDTLMDVQDELRAMPWPRAPMPTVGYHEVPLDRGDARAGPLPPEPLAVARAFDPRNASSPEIEVTLTDVSLRALTALDGSTRPEEAGEAGPAEAAEGEGGRTEIEGDDPFAPFGQAPGSTRASTPSGVRAAGLPFEAFELRSFIVPPSVLGPRSTNEQRLGLVREHFTGLLPCPPDRVRRVDARVLEAGSLMLIVWCPIE